MSQETKSNNHTAMSPQQKRLSSADSQGLRIYKDLVVGASSWWYLCGFEFYTTLISNIAGLLGYGLRSFCLRYFLQSMGRGCAVGRGVVLRIPRKISFGKKVVIEDYVALDVREKLTDANSNARIVVGDNVFIGRHSIIAAKGASIFLGNACNISSHCRIATQNGVHIGSSVLIAAYAYIGPGNHKFDNLDTPIIEQGMVPSSGVRIEDNVWIGTRATILDGITIGKNAIVGAHALVTKDVPEGAIVAGSPAKVIRMRAGMAA